jgi:hypothetical protein
VRVTDVLEFGELALDADVHVARSSRTPSRERLRGG